MLDIKEVIARCWPLAPGSAASDGSVISKAVWEEYLRSPQYHESIEAGNALGSLTHASRDNKHLSHITGSLEKTIGKDDLLLTPNIPNAPTPVWRLKELFIQDDWLMARLDILDENTCDDLMAQSIKRLKGLLSNGVCLGVSLVVVAFWSSDKGGGDVCQKIHNIKGLDLTMNPANRQARIVDVLDSEGDSILEGLRTFSEKEESQMKSGTPVAKCFSDTSCIPGISDLPKTSKIGLKFTTLKVKEFSCLSEITAIEKSDSTILDNKTFSVAAVKERLRYGKMSPRMQFRRLMIDYKGAMKASQNLSESDIQIMKSLFANDILMIVKQIHPEVMKGKQIATLIGASSISKNARVASQKLQ